MPRGVKGSGKPKGSPVQVAPQPQQAPQEPQAQPVIADSGPLGSVDVDRLSGDSLKRYARRAGVMQRDVDGLTEDRLRQNVKVLIAEHFELLTED